jgi:hypothetical protein
MFEHAGDCRMILKHLQQLESTEVTEESVPQIYVKLQGNESSSAEGSSEAKDAENESPKNTVLTLKRSFLNLTLKANGKADLYFHAYFWHSFALSLYLRADPSGTLDTFDADVIKRSVEHQRLHGLADFLKKVNANVNKYLFTMETYNKLVEEFGGRKPVKSKKLLEDI